MSRQLATYSKPWFGFSKGYFIALYYRLCYKPSVSGKAYLPFSDFLKSDFSEEDVLKHLSQALARRLEYIRLLEDFEKKSTLIF